MKQMRVVLAWITMALLLTGYLASQSAYLFQVPADPSSYAAKLDQLPIKILALVLFVLAIVFAFVSEREETSK